MQRVLKEVQLVGQDVITEEPGGELPEPEGGRGGEGTQTVQGRLGGTSQRHNQGQTKI